MPLVSIRHMLTKALRLKHANELRKPRRFIIASERFADVNLSTIDEGIEPLLPDNIVPRPTSSTDSHSRPQSTCSLSPGRLSDDPAIAKYVVESEDENHGDRRHSTKMPVVDSDQDGDLMPEGRFLRHRDSAELRRRENEPRHRRRTGFELRDAHHTQAKAGIIVRCQHQQMEKDLDRIYQDFVEYRQWAEGELRAHHQRYNQDQDEIYRLKKQIKLLSKRGCKKRLMQQIDGLRETIEHQQDNLNANLRTIKEGNQWVAWLDEENWKLNQENVTLEHQVRNLWRQLETQTSN